MKAQFNINFPLSVCILCLAVAGLPQLASAQRFNHANFGGGGGNRPAVSRPAPVMNRPAPAATRAAPVSRQAPVMNRPAEPQANNRSISGGSRNFGNHDFNQNRNTNPAPERGRVNENRNTTVHENVNIYHAHGGEPSHAYAYHPYHPYIWGHNWHPLGFFAAALAADAFRFSLANQQYYYDEGVYYAPSSGGYSVVPAPVGATVSSLPPGYETTMVGNDYYYYYGGAFYINTGSAYQVVPAPPGAVVTQIPDGAVEQDIDGQTYLVFNNTYYQPVSENGEDAYEVVQMN
ncbi:MAG: DUF6515 family protein [Chitinophagales bacterium]